MKSFVRSSNGVNLLLLLLFFIVTILSFSWYNNRYSDESVYNHLQKDYLERERNLELELNNVVKGIESDSEFFELLSLNENSDVETFIYDNDTLVYWSVNNIPVPEIFDYTELDHELLFLKNGVFISRSTEINRYKVLVLSKFKSEYSYQNEFLINDFTTERGVDFFQISNKETEFPIKNKNDYTVCYLELKNEQVVNNVLFQYFLLTLMLIIFGLFVKLLIGIYKKFPWWSQYKNLMVLGLVIDVIIVRVLLFYLEIHQLLGLELFFDSVLYSSSFVFGSLGDLVLNSFVLLICSYLFYYEYEFRNTITKNKISVLVGVFLQFLVVFSFLGYILFVKDLVLNSNFSMNLANISQFNDAGVVGLITLASVSVSTFLIIYRLIYMINSRFSLLKWQIIFSVGVYLFVFILCQFYFDIEFLWLLLVTYPIYFAITLLQYRGIELANFSFSMVYVFLFAILSTLALMRFNSIREFDERKQFAAQIAESRDTMAEFRFQQLYDEMKSDPVIKNIITDAYDFKEKEDELIQYVKKNYLNGFWSKYQLQFTICKPDTRLNITNEKIVIDCEDYFNDIISAFGSPTISNNFYFVENRLEEANYLAKLSYPTYMDSVVHLYIDFNPQLSQETLGYPELLIDESTSINAVPINHYSYAVYYDHKLIKSSGKYIYSLFVKENEMEDDYFWMKNRNSYSHLYHQVNDKKVVIVSKKNADLLETLAPFSYTLLVFGLFIFAFLIVVRFSFSRIMPDMNFRKRIQTSIIGIIILSFVLILAISIIYLQKLQMDKNYEILNEKSFSVLTELEHKLSDREYIDYEMEEYIETLLSKFSLVFNSDLNLYDLEGNLLASSRPQIFQDGLISKKMNSNAFYYMNTKQKSLFIHEEKIGEYGFLSAYVPFRNYNNEIIAYLNLPYFARQSELTDEIYTFFVAFINVYIILTVIAVFIGILVSNYITRPLQLMKSQLSHVNFGEGNNKLAWSKDDEIGSLVRSYNEMIDQLEESAELLARSERESAWREMAKQVAHEIKNPLTPMKLSVQYLKRAWDDKADDWDNRLDRFTNTLIEQIDSLSSIASAFSDFAKMPKTEYSEVDLVHSIKSAVDIFDDISHNVNIKLDHYPENYFIVRTDAKQIVRVFNNLLKNAIQAIPDNREGIIDIKIYQDNDYVIATIQDNGKGIPKEMWEQIFTPNFTTKSSGMGLGLAIVKNIVVNSGGEIYFKTELDIGTTFYVKFPMKKN